MKPGSQILYSRTTITIRFRKSISRKIKKFTYSKKKFREIKMSEGELEIKTETIDIDETWLTYPVFSNNHSILKVKTNL